MKLKIFFGYTLTLFFTLILLEVSSFFLFQSLTEKEFTYATLQNERLARIAAIQKRLQTTQSQELYNFHPYLGYVDRPGAYPWGEGYPPFNEYGMLSITKHPYPYKKGNNEFVIAVVGGSVADIFANKVEEFLNQYLRKSFGFDKKLVLVNLATGGYKQPQQLFHVQYALLSTEAQINRYFRTKGLRVGLPRHKARRGNPLWLPLVASIKIPQNLGFST